jgi:TRAP transporter TAXI family solute receptor
VTQRRRAILGSLVLLSLAGPAQALEAGAVVTGPKGSTAGRFGQDIADLARRFDIGLEVVPSQGGPDTIETLTRRPGTQLGIVPSDVLDFVGSFSEDPQLRSMAALMLVFPLYHEEVHVLARPGIASFADLQGTRVAMGAANSGTLLTATLLLGTAGVRPAEEVRIGGEEALKALRDGRLDAMIDVAGQPSALFRDKVAIEDALHLVPVDHPALKELYPLAAIPADTYYPWQPKEVPTVAPQALLMTLRWTEPGQQEACRLVGKVARIVADNLDRLRREGHPKWREVNLDAKPPPGSDWPRSPCVAQALAAPESYALAADGKASPAAGPAPQGRPGPQAGTPARACSAETNPILRRLCEVRPLLGSGP